MLDFMTDWFYTVFVARLDGWVALGFAAQFMFMSRFVVQWVVSERTGRSVIPGAFWLFSIGGGTLLLVYAIHKQDPVFIVGQFFGLFIYSRNIWFILREHQGLSLWSAPPGGQGRSDTKVKTERRTG